MRYWILLAAKPYTIKTCELEDYIIIYNVSDIKYRRVESRKVYFQRYKYKVAYNLL